MAHALGCHVTQQLPDRRADYGSESIDNVRGILVAVGLSAVLFWLPLIALVARTL